LIDKQEKQTVMRRLNVAELTADTDTALQYEAEVKN